MRSKLELYPTTITPFSEDLSIDYRSMEKLIAYFAACACDGLFAVCQSSEMFWLSEDEKIGLAAFCITQCRRHGMKCVVSGHTQADLLDQISYLKRLEELGPDAIILVSNRLAMEDQADTVLTGNLDIILSSLRPETRLGMYECPYPYKRLLSPAVITYLAQTGRFDFLKDTSCRLETIRHRLRQLDGSTLRLYNANAATLLESFLAGATGYSGVMLNVMPELFNRLKMYSTDYEWPAGTPRTYDKRMAESLADLISLMSVIEYQNYPANAKYVLHRKGVIGTTLTRNGRPQLTESQIREMDSFLNHTEMAYARLDGHEGREMLFQSGVYFHNCHASTLLPLEDGTVLAAYFAGTREGDPDVGIWLSRREAGTWQSPVCIAKVGPAAHWNPVLFRSGQGIRLVFKVGRDVPTWKSWTQVSIDQGLTWSTALCYPEPESSCGPVRSKPLILSDGRMLAPNSIETETEWLPAVDESTDDGEHFTRLSMIPLNTQNPQATGYLAGLGAIQPTLWESARGQVHMLLRTTCGRIFRSDSTDGGATWCGAYDTGLPSNNSGIEIACRGRELYLIMNPSYGNWGVRNPLVVKKSTDNGVSFQPYATLENMAFDAVTGGSAEFSYPAAVIQENRLHITYTCNRRQIAYHRFELGPESCTANPAIPPLFA